MQDEGEKRMGGYIMSARGQALLRLGPSEKRVFRLLRPSPPKGFARTPAVETIAAVSPTEKGCQEQGGGEKKKKKTRHLITTQRVQSMFGLAIVSV
jgi:hypothetical protein